jgi:formiminoglutamase
VTLPLLLSVPHAGLTIPAVVASLCQLTPQEVEKDGDVGARHIYDLESLVTRFATSTVARAIVDLNRAPDDRRVDGVIKTQTCWQVPIYRTFPSEAQIQQLLAEYYHPYHARLSAAATAGLVLAVDCHTMAAIGPPIGPDPGQERPYVCLSHGDGTCPDAWMKTLVQCFQDEFGPVVSVNAPFTGGYITRTHAAEMPWVQLELSRAPFRSLDGKRDGVARALSAWVARHPHQS